MSKLNPSSEDIKAAFDQSAQTSNHEPSYSTLKTDAQLEERIKAYEQRYGMSSDEFLRRWSEDADLDDYDMNLWATLIRFHANNAE